MSIDKTFMDLDSLIDSAALEKVIKDIENILTVLKKLQIINYPNSFNRIRNRVEQIIS